MVSPRRWLRRAARRAGHRPHSMHILRPALAGVALCMVVSGAFVATLEAAGAPWERADGGDQPAIVRALGFAPGFAPYIYRTTGEQADPVNLIFRADDGATVAKAVRQVLGWQQIDSTPMQFRDTIIRPTGWQFQLPLGPGTRFHIRIESVNGENGQDYVLAAVHRDDPMPCGHIGNAFDDTRDMVAQSFATAGYQVTRVALGNTDPGKQCDGSYTAGDGIAVIVDLRQS